MVKRKVDPETFISTYRVLSAASGFDNCSIRVLKLALGVTQPTAIRWLKKLNLARNSYGMRRGIHPKSHKTGLRVWSKRNPPRGLSAKPKSTPALRALRVIRAIEAVTGKRASMSAVAGCLGCSSQNVNQLESCLFPKAPKTDLDAIELEKRTNANSARAASLVKKGKKLTAAKFEEKLKRAIRVETRKRILTELAQGAKKSVLAEKYNMSTSGVGYITNG